MLSDSFYLTGAVSNTSALFTYDSEYLLDTYYNVPRHDASFLPVFTVPDSPEDPLANETSKICSGEGSQFCRYENTYHHNSKQRTALWEISDKKECLASALQVWYLGRSKPSNGKGYQGVFPESRFSRAGFKTRWVNRIKQLKRFQLLLYAFTSQLNYCYTVVSCGWLSPPINGKKEGTTYLQGAKVRLSCNDGYSLKGSEVRVCQGDGQWSGEDTECTAPSTKTRWN